MFLGFEVNEAYAQAAQAVTRASVRCENFFEKNWPETLNRLREPVLLVGNPPWVTNAAVGALDGANLPVKTNLHRLSGLDALTGKSNFDISEWMLVHLLECLSGREAILAMLCKTAVARKVLRSAWDRSLAIRSAAIYSIDAAEHFGAAVDACLLVCILEPGGASSECVVYADLESSELPSTFAFRDGRLVADLDAFETYGHLSGRSPSSGESGIKHDCSSVMELRPKGRNTFENGLGQVVNLESSYLYPMVKSSELMKPRPTPTRRMLVTQRRMGEDTAPIGSEAPLTWDYLQSHGDRLDGRASSIYRNRPRFSVFGVGSYTFAPWKVAYRDSTSVSNSAAWGPVENKPVVFDDTCYFLRARPRAMRPSSVGF